MNFPVRLVHETHGATHVYDREQLDLHEKRGWKVEEVKVEVKKVGRPKKVSNA
jgi:hypothetical protein